jgi:hypothetical protein
MGSGKFKVPHAVKGVMAMQSEPGRVMLGEDGVAAVAGNKKA